jgi:hypothetical protein
MSVTAKTRRYPVCVVMKSVNSNIIVAFVRTSEPLGYDQYTVRQDFSPLVRR